MTTLFSPKNSKDNKFISTITELSPTRLSTTRQLNHNKDLNDGRM